MECFYSICAASWAIKTLVIRTRRKKRKKKRKEKKLKLRLGRLKDKGPLNRFDALGNLSLVFTFLKKANVKIHNIGPEDVYNGNVKLIQGLVWTLIQKFVLTDDTEDDAAELSSGSPKQRLLQWVRTAVVLSLSLS
jgi:hypothetical protein